MRIDRKVFINPVEPEYVAFKFSSGIDTKIDFHFKDETGQPYEEDVVAQLQMTSRTRGTTEYYSVPAIDIPNGVARVLVPGDLTHDPNGWQLRLTGTVASEPRVLAYGLATAIAGAGPQAQPQDIIDSIDLTLTQSINCVMTVKVWQDEGKASPFDLTVATVAAAVYASRGGALLQPFTVAPVNVNTVTLTMLAAAVNTLPANCWWNLTVASGGGTTTIAEGNVTVTP